MDWLAIARKWAEAGQSPNEMYEMPFSRLYAVYFMPPEDKGQVPIDSVEDLREIRNERRKKMGLPLIPDTKPEDR